MSEPLDNPAFERWCYSATDPQSVSPFGDGHPLPLLTTFLHRVCGNDRGQFEEGLRVLRAAFDAGQEAGKEPK